MPPKPKTNHSSDFNNGAMDRCQTPAYAINPLREFLNPEWVVWEPAVGEGSLQLALFPYVRHVYGTDILTGHNFLTMGPRQRIDAIITNPPYGNPAKWQFIARCYELQVPWALLMPVEVLGSQTAQAMFQKHGMEVILLDQRINFKMPNKGFSGAGAQFPVAWYTHGFNLGSPIIYGKVDRPKNS